MSDETQEIEDDPAELVELIAMEWMQDLAVSEPTKQQFRDALAKFVDERIAAVGVNATPPKWRKGTKLIKRGKLWLDIVTPADRDVYVVTRDSWADSPTWVEPLETAKI
jgi:hypothetical protein